MKRLLTLSLLTSALLMGAAPTTGDILRQVEPPKVPETAKTLPPVGDGEYKAPLSAKDDVKIFVKSFAFSGNTAFNSEELAALVISYEKKELGINGLKDVASVITKFYRDRGYFVTRAYIPAQNMENGIVEITIIEGHYGSFEMNNSSLVGTSEVAGFMDYLKEGEVISTMSLERQMLLINDLSGAQVTNAEVYPGKEVGTSDFRITISPTSKYNGYAVADNYGTSYTGANRLSVGGFVNSLTGIGDTLSITGLVSNTADLKNTRIGYERPLGYNGLKGGVNGSVTDYTLDKINNYEAFGKIYSYNAYLSYPIVKTRAHTQILEASYDHKLMKDSSGISGNVEESQRIIDALTLKASDKRNTGYFNLPGALHTSVGFTGGHLDLGNDVAKLNDELGLNAGGNYAKINLNVTHNQYLIEKTTLRTLLKAQKSFGKNLNSSEDFSVGGSNGVRAYEDSELSGDQGYAISLDLIYALPDMDTIRHNTSIFFDHARVWKNSTVFNTEENIRNLNAIGFGYGLTYKRFDLKASWAHGFGSGSIPISEAEFSTNKNKFLIQGIARF